mmetsp:Transcript_32096/g.66436  ORF Transcript_32096/g.66436 Transcript_32096/m.66436 type:complete len:584 (-) Transcript_32096:47-1798(-)
MEKSAVWDGNQLEKAWISKRSKSGVALGMLSIVPTEDAKGVNLSDSGSFREGLLHISQAGTTIHSAKSAAVDAASPPSCPSTGSRSTTSAKRANCTDDVRYELSHADFENMEVIGRGSSGFVRKALRKSSNEVMALKVINVFEEEKRKQMMQEVIMMCDSRHAGLIRFHGAFFHEGTISVALEYMTGGSLNDVLKISGAIPENVLACMAKQILDGMAFMHEKKQVHRDFKPCNLLVDHSGLVKITDFGVAAELDSSLVKCTTFVGTYLYMSPERFGSEPYSFPSDVWSFGLVLIECATAEYPYLRNSGKTYWELMDAIVKCEAPSLPPEQTFSPALHDFIAHCLHKDPKHRASAKMLRDHEFVQSSKAAAPQSEEAERAALEAGKLTVSEWLGTVRTCFVSGNIPGAASFNPKDAAKDFAAFYLSYFSPKRRGMLWSLYRDSSALHLIEADDDATAAAAAAAGEAAEGSVEKPKGNLTVIEGREGIMTHLMNLPVALDPVPVSSWADHASFNAADGTLSLSCPCTVREIANSRAKGRAGKKHGGEVVSLEYHGEVERTCMWFVLRPDVVSKSYTIVSHTIPVW